MKKFKAIHRFFTDDVPMSFSEKDIPGWLTGKEGTAYDNRWFTEKYILNLEIGESVDTDFHVITRIS